jgi:probable rRNA maturation factor
LASIRFHNESVSYKLNQKKLIASWLHSIASEYNAKCDEIVYVFCNDDYLLNLNQRFLNHDTFTDIITFDYGERDASPTLLKGEIYISIERVKDNARNFEQAFSVELMRVMAHGILHLCGLKDKSQAEKKVMREAEEEALRNARMLGLIG